MTSQITNLFRSKHFSPNTRGELIEAIMYYCQHQRLGKLRYGQIGTWDVSKITDMSNLFSYNCVDFNEDISNWDVSNVTNMHGMFMYAHKFNGMLVNWNVSKVTDMSFMFYDALEFNQDINYSSLFHNYHLQNRYF